DIHHLPRSRRDADGARRTDVQEAPFEVAIAVKHLNTPVAGVGDVDETLRIDGDAARLAELTGSRAGLPPGADKLSVLVEFRDARVAQTVGNVDIAGCVPGHISRSVEDILLAAGTGRASPPAPASRRFGIGSAAAPSTTTRLRRSSTAATCGR